MNQLFKRDIGHQSNSVEISINGDANLIADTDCIVEIIRLPRLVANLNLKSLKSFNESVWKITRLSKFSTVAINKGDQLNIKEGEFYKVISDSYTLEFRHRDDILVLYDPLGVHETNISKAYDYYSELNICRK